MIKRIFFELTLAYISICSLMLLWVFPYSNFFEVFQKYGGNFWGRLDLVNFIFYAILMYKVSNYILFKKAQRSLEEVQKISWVSSVGFSFFATFIFILYNVLFTTLQRCVDFCGITSFFATPLVFLFYLVFFSLLVRRVQKNLENSRPTEEVFRTLFYSDSHYKKYIFIFFSIILVCLTLITFDYRTHGEYLKISRESNATVIVSEANIGDDISICSKSKGDITCYSEFLNAHSDEFGKFISAKEGFEYFNNKYCSVLSKYKDVCQKALYEDGTLNSLLDKELNSANHFPTGFQLVGGGYVPMIISVDSGIISIDMIRMESVYASDSSYIEAVTEFKKTLPQSAYFTLDRTYRAIHLTAPVSIFLQDSIGFYDYLNKELYPALFAVVNSSTRLQK